MQITTIQIRRLRKRMREIISPARLAVMTDEEVERELYKQAIGLTHKDLSVLRLRVWEAYEG